MSKVEKFMLWGFLILVTAVSLLGIYTDQPARTHCEKMVETLDISIEECILIITK